MDKQQHNPLPPNPQQHANQLLQNLPAALQERPQWVVHKAKQPFHPGTGRGAKAGDPSTWVSFPTALDAYRQGGYDGIGFEFHNNGLVGIDLDTVRDPISGAVAPDALELIQMLNSYTELSPSGYGFHILCWADTVLSWNKVRLPANGIRRIDLDNKTGLPRCDTQGNPLYKHPELELYTAGRYFTMTGNIWAGQDALQERTQEVAALQQNYAPRRGGPTRIVPVNRRSQPSGTPDYLSIGLERDSALRALWDGARPNGNESADDLALMNKLAYWCGCDLDAMLNAFQAAPHFVQKDSAHAKKAQRADYLRRTAQRAILDCGQTAQERDQMRQSTRTKRQTVKQALAFMEVFQPGEAMPELLHYDRNDIGNAERFLTMNEGTVRYNRESNAWYIWNGLIWELDLTGKIYRLAIQTAKRYKHTADRRYQELLQAEQAYRQDPDVYLTTHQCQPPLEAKTLRKTVHHATTCGAAPRITAMIDTAGHAAYIQQAELDQHKHLITCRNGTVDLQTGRLTPHRAADFLTKLVDVSYIPDAPAPLFTAFLHRTFQDDPELIHYIRTVLGYCLTGETGEQCFFIGYGTGANGKSTLIETICSVLLDHTQSIPTGVLMDKDRETAATPELARAKSARLVIASESKDLSSLNEAQIKQLTGGDLISARPLYSQGFEYRPMFKIWLSTNHKPTIKGTDNGIWRRVHLIPFAVTIPESEQDTQLLQKLQAERAGILAWLVAGAQDYYANGLHKPAAVRAATEEYRTEMDLLGGFLSDCTHDKPGAFTRSSALYQAYVGWCQTNGVDALKQNAFSRKMTDRGRIVRRTAIARGYMDVELNENG